MKILLVAVSDFFPRASQILNPELEYCAIVTDEPEETKKFAGYFGLTEESVYQFYDLKELIQSLEYDFLLCISSWQIAWDIHKTFREYGLPKNKFVHFCLADEFNDTFIVERALRYYREHAEDFEIFATGISYTVTDLEVEPFEYGMLNFGRSSQDLYYDYKIAQFVLSECAGNKIRYALIGLAPYSFHLDQSQSYALAWRILPYFVAFEDLHNFWIPKDLYRKFFREDFFSTKMSLEDFDVSNVVYEKQPANFMTLKTKIDAREKIDAWANKNFPETRDENIKILDEYLTLCEEKNVRPIIFFPPMTEGVMKHFNPKMLEEFYQTVGDAMTKHSATGFLDGRKLKRFFSDADFYDIDHLNFRGATKFSSILNNLILHLEGK